MGQTNSAALGFARAQPDEKVVLCDSEGSLQMNMGVLATVAGKKPKNFFHFLMDNECYATTGGQPVPNASEINYAGMAKQAGYAAAFEFDNLEDFTNNIEKIMKAEGPVFVAMKLIPQVHNGLLGRPWAQPSQRGRPWPGQADDPDCDGFETTTESFVGTDPNDACADTEAVNDEADDKWPTDMNDNQRTNTLDVAFYVGNLNTFAPGPPYTVRLDLTLNGIVNTLDIAKYVPLLNDVCTGLPEAL